MKMCDQKDLKGEHIDAETKKYLQEHQIKMEELGLSQIQEAQLDKNNIDQEFYKISERQFGKYIVTKHGYKICKVKRQEQDLAFYCFGLLQAQAKFPIKVFHIDHSRQQSPLDYEKSGLKVFWLQTSIMMAGATYSQSNELIFQHRVYKFYKGYLIPEIRKFMKARINWQYMVSPDYTDIQVISQFKKTVIEKANKQFMSMIKQHK